MARRRARVAHRIHHPWHRARGDRKNARRPRLHCARFESDDGRPRSLRAVCRGGRQVSLIDSQRNSFNGSLTMQPSETAVVTGASSGIGEACARRLLHLGIGVVTLQRSAPKLQHPNLHFRKIDLADNDATRVLAREIAAEFSVRYLVNNAGANRPAPLEDATIDDMQYVTAVTLGAAMVLTQAFVPGMRPAKFGRIVDISSRA